MAKVNIEPELMEKLSEITRIHIKQFNDAHRWADERFGECDPVGVTRLLWAQRSVTEAKYELIRDNMDKKITDDEMHTIIGRLNTFNEAKIKDFPRSLEKCGCKFK